VTGRKLGELRHEVEKAELAVFDRFNDINSDDRFDIHCYNQVRWFSHIQERVCRSNSWRDQEAEYSEATLLEMKGQAGPNPRAFRAEQARMAKLLLLEMQRLASEDPALREAMAHLYEARTAAGEALASGGVETASIEMPTDGLPFDAKRAYVVRVGRTPWSHTLTQRTFTLGQVDGDVRKLEIECGDFRKRLDYQEGVDWSVPAGADGCILLVNAKPDTTFALYELE
jgi:hypothetical protein